MKISGSVQLAHSHPHHGILHARNTQTQVVLRIWNDVVRNLIISGATIKAVVGDLRRDSAKLIGRMSLQLGLAEGFLGEA